jgi:hypothetical protein
VTTICFLRFPSSFPCYTSITAIITAAKHCTGTHHAEGLVNPKVRGQKKVTAFGYPRECRFRKHQIEKRFPEFTLPTLKKTVIFSSENVLKWAKMGKN